MYTCLGELKIFKIKQEKSNKAMFKLLHTCFEVTL